MGHGGEELVRMMRRVKGKGATLIYVSDRMEEIFQLADTVTVLRDGRHVATEAVANLSREKLIRQMVGRDVLAHRPNHLDLTPGEEILRVENLSSMCQVENVGFSVRRSEIVGMAERVGGGRAPRAQRGFGMAQRARARTLIYSRPTTLGKPPRS